jgi:hypothetical protein
VQKYLRAILIIASLVIPLAAVPGAQSDDDGAKLSGDWTGESICTDNNPSCHDEKVIYHISRLPDATNKFKLVADKIIDGKPEWMYTLDFTYDAKTGMLTGEFQSARYHGLFEYKVKGNEMEGTLSLLPARTIGRRIKVQKVESGK